MEPIETMDLLFEVGTLHGRSQAFASIAARCSAAVAQYLRETRESKQYRASGLNWRQYPSSTLCNAKCQQLIENS